MTNHQLSLYIMFNEPDFDYKGKRYSIRRINRRFYTQDSDGNALNFPEVEYLLLDWKIAGVPFQDIVDQVLFDEEKQQ